MTNLARADVAHLPLAAESVDMIWADPPYLKQYLPCYDWLALEAERVLKPGGFVFAMCGEFYLNRIIGYLELAGLSYFWAFVVGPYEDSPYIWPRRIVARNKHILAYSKGTGTPRINSVLSLFDGTQKSKTYHHWGQDVASARYYIDCFSAPGDLVLDPFIGGGTTAVACELIGRRFVGFDLDPAALATSAARLSSAEIPYQGTLFEKVAA